MQKVDPFIREVPSRFSDDPEAQEFFEYLIRWCHDIWKRTGGGNDDINELFNINGYATAAINGRVNANKAEIDTVAIQARVNHLAGMIAALMKQDSPSTLGPRVRQDSPSTLGSVGVSIPTSTTGTGLAPDLFTISKLGA